MNLTVQKIVGRLIVPILLLCFAAAVPGVASAGQPQPAQAQVEVGGGEAALIIPDLSSVDFRGVNGRTLLMGGLVICALGLVFGLMTFTQLKNLPVHASMLEVSELIYETCKT
jgi:K(+)-stimulated pyrophosphate-energized sodium pump